MDGLVYLLNEAGNAIAALKAEIARLTAENEQLRASLAESVPATDAPTD